MRCSKAVTHRLTVVVPGDLLERARNAVYWSPDLTVTSLVERALSQYLERIEQQHGEPYPSRLEPLRRGRPKRLAPRREAAGPEMAPPGPPCAPDVDEAIGDPAEQVGAML